MANTTRETVVPITQYDHRRTGGAAPLPGGAPRPAACA